MLAPSDSDGRYAKPALLISAAIVGLAVLIHSCNRLEKPITFYPSTKELAAETMIDRGWVPPEMPRSATNIFLRTDLDLNVSILAFEASRDDLDSLKQTLDQIDPTQIPNDSVPNLVVGIKWWPRALWNPNKNSATLGSYVFFKTNRSSKARNTFYFAVDAKGNRCFVWQ